MYYSIVIATYSYRKCVPVPSYFHLCNHSNASNNSNKNYTKSTE